MSEMNPIEKLVRDVRRVMQTSCVLVGLMSLVGLYLLPNPERTDFDMCGIAILFCSVIFCQAQLLTIKR